VGPHLGGQPAFLSGRTHPMGILVEERGMAWNYPTGNEDIIYFVFTFYNVTASDPAAYTSIDPAIRSEIAAIGEDFQARNEARFGINIPAGGYAFDSMYAAFFSDQDVGDAGRNYGTAVLPFNMMTAYKADFLEPNWTFPPEIFGAPFVKSPGFIGMQFLKSPAGLSIWSNTLNSGTGYPDPVGVKQLYRYLSGARARRKATSLARSRARSAQSTSASPPRTSPTRGASSPRVRSRCSRAFGDNRRSLHSGRADRRRLAVRRRRLQAGDPGDGGRVVLVEWNPGAPDREGDGVPRPERRQCGRHHPAD